MGDQRSFMWPMARQPLALRRWPDHGAAPGDGSVCRMHFSPSVTNAVASMRQTAGVVTPTNQQNQLSQRSTAADWCHI